MKVSALYLPLGGAVTWHIGGDDRRLLTARAFPFHAAPGQLLLRVSPSDLTRAILKGLLSTFEIWRSIETVALDKIGFMGVQYTPIDRERDKLQFALKDHSVRCHYLLSFPGHGPY